MMKRIDLAPSFDALEAVDPAFAEVRKQFGLDKLDVTSADGTDDASVDSNYNPELETIDVEGAEKLRVSLTNLTLNADAVRAIQSGAMRSDARAIRATLESEGYDAAAIRAEFQSYRDALPSPDVLLQEQPSYAELRRMLADGKREPPRFLKYKFEKGIKAHHALCCVLLTDYAAAVAREKAQRTGMGERQADYPSLIWMLLSCGMLLPQINNPAAFIRYQFGLVANAIPMDAVAPDVLRKTIRDRGLPLPNFFLDPGDNRAFPPHIALLVILQDGEKESRKLDSVCVRAGVGLFAIVALLLRVVLEVIGGAGAIWGGAEVFTLRTADNHALWRRVSISVGVLCLLRFLTLNLPRVEDEGDILGPAGPWSLRLPLRLRAVCDHPFHYFVRACPRDKWARARDTHSRKTARLF